MRSILTSTSLAVLMALPGVAHAVLEVSIDTPIQNHVFTDGDADGDVEIDTTLDGMLEVRAIFKEQQQAFRTRLAIAPLPPFLEAVFANVTASPFVTTATVSSDALTTPVAPPVGWDIFYNGSTDDPVDMSVDVPTHSVEGLINAEAISLGTINAPAVASISSFEHDLHGVRLADTASDVSIVWQFQLGANDEIRLPSDDDFEGESIQVNVFNQSQKCVDKMNNYARQVANTSQKDDQKCLKTTGVDVTICVDNPAEEKTESKETKLVEAFASYCDPVPAWGVEGDGCCDGGTGDGTVCADSATCGGGTCLEGECIAAAADGATNDLIHDLFGATVVVSADKATYKCQQAVWKSMGQLYVERWKQFRGCKKDNFATVTDDVSLVATCLDPQPDPKTKIEKRRLKVIDTVQNRCLDQGLSGLGAIFPGACSSEADVDVGACAIELAACRFCQSANAADAIDPSLDCDLFDDGLANASCAP